MYMYIYICIYIHIHIHIYMYLRIYLHIRMNVCMHHQKSGRCTIHTRFNPRVVAHCVAVCCNVLQCVAVCCCVLQCVAVCCRPESQSLNLIKSWCLRISISQSRRCSGSLIAKSMRSPCGRYYDIHTHTQIRIYIYVCTYTYINTCIHMCIDILYRKYLCKCVVSTRQVLWYIYT